MDVTMRPIDRPAADSAPVPIDPATFRDVLSHFATGVVVVTALDGDRPVGLTCQSFTALSLEPPMILFCPARTSTSWPAVARAGRLCVNILRADQHEISSTFARSGADKFAGVAWSPLPDGGAPALDRAAAHIGARIAEVYDGGDHHIVTCHVQILRASDAGEPRDASDPGDPGDAADAREGGGPLLYYRSRYRHLRPLEAPPPR